MVTFECNSWVFSKIRPGERPNLMHECDTLLLAAIRRVNLKSFWSRATRTVDGTCQLVNRGLALSRMVGAWGPYCEPGQDMRLRFKWFWTQGVRESITRTTSNLTQFLVCGQIFIVRPLARL
jgi:hypothetical protein